MKKYTGKNKERGKDKYTVTEVGTLIEHFECQFKVFGEGQNAIREKLDATYEQVGKNTEEIVLLKVAVQKNTEEIGSLKTDVTSLKTDVTSIKTDVTSLKTDVTLLKTDVTSIKTDVTSIKTIIQKHTEEIISLKVIVQNVTTKIDKLVESIEKLIRTKVDREEFQVLEKRISTLEAKMASLAR